MPSVSHFPELALPLEDQPSLLVQAREMVVTRLRSEDGWTLEAARDKVFSGGISNVLVGVYQVRTKRTGQTQTFGKCAIHLLHTSCR